VPPIPPIDESWSRRLAAMSRGRLALIGAAGSVLVAIASTALAFVASDRCTPLSGVEGDPLGEPNWLCEAANFPGVPDTFASTLVVTGVYLLPVAVAVIGSIAAVAAYSRRALAMTGAASVALLAVTLVLTFVAETGWRGLG
jgi:hypothetical protein